MRHSSIFVPTRKAPWLVKRYEKSRIASYEHVNLYHTSASKFSWKCLLRSHFCLQGVFRQLQDGTYMKVLQTRWNHVEPSLNDDLYSLDVLRHCKFATHLKANLFQSKHPNANLLQTFHSSPAAGCNLTFLSLIELHISLDQWRCRFRRKFQPWTILHNLAHIHYPLENSVWYLSVSKYIIVKSDTQLNYLCISVVKPTSTGLPKQTNSTTESSQRVEL